MPRLRLTRNALQDVERAYAFYRETVDEACAAKAVNALYQAIKLLEDMPGMGRPAQDLEPEHRELLAPFGGSGYVILYRVEKDTVYILAVRHQKESGY